MANKKQIYKHNSDGNFFVDTTCIDCGTCYWIAQDHFKRTGNQSAVVNQPSNEEEVMSAYHALYSCPTNSIGVHSRDEISKSAISSFPRELAPNVFHCGFHSEKSYGATSYLVKGDEGNYLIDCPRFTNQLVNKIEALGGVDFHFLSHKDDIADTNKYFEKFNAPRFIHIDDETKDTKEFENKFEGEEIVSLNNEVKMIPVPGHTKGSVCYLIQDKYLFTGDHLAFSPELDHLYAFKSACWYDFEIHIKSMERLLDFEFTHVFPGHGAPFIASSVSEMKKQMIKCTDWMKAR